MATLTQAPVFMSVEQYLRTFDYEPDAEYVDGYIEERPMGVREHAAWQKAILLFFAKHEDDWGVRVFVELRVHTSTTRYRIPDVSVLAADAPNEQIPSHPPLAVFEVLSPDDRIKRMLKKLWDYERMGIGQIWVIDPKNPEWLRFEHGELLPEGQCRLATLNIGFPMEEISKLVR